MFGPTLSCLNYVSPDMSMGLTGRSVCSISDVRYVHLVGIRNNRGCCLVRIFAEDIFKHLRPGDIVTVAFDYTALFPFTCIQSRYKVPWTVTEMRPYELT
jgi:hypothetical protein